MYASKVLLLSSFLKLYILRCLEDGSHNVRLGSQRFAYWLSDDRIYICNTFICRNLGLMLIHTLHVGTIYTHSCCSNLHIQIWPYLRVYIQRFTLNAHSDRMSSLDNSLIVTSIAFTNCTLQMKITFAHMELTWLQLADSSSFSWYTQRAAQWDLAMANTLHWIADSLASSELSPIPLNAYGLQHCPSAESHSSKMIRDHSSHFAKFRRWSFQICRWSALWYTYLR